MIPVQSDAYVLLLVIAAGLGISLAIYIMRHKGIAGGRLVGMILLLAAWYALTYAFELVSLSMEARLFWIKAEYVAIVSFLPVLLIFSLRFSGLTRYLKVPLYLALLVEPLLTLAMIWTTPAHTWYYQSYSLVITGTHFKWSVVYGPGFWAHTLYSALLFAVCMVIFIRKMFHSSQAHRRQAGVVLLGICLTGLGTVVYTARLGWLVYDQTPLLGLLSGGIIAWFVVRSRFFEFSPIALEAVLHSMGDGVILLDLRSRILRLNPAAEQILGRTTTEAELLLLETVLPEMAGRFTTLAVGDDASLELELGPAAARRVYLVRVSAIREGRHHIAGRLLLLHDITERKEAQERLRQLAIHDPLTGLYNRYHLPEALETAQSQAAQSCTPLSVIMLDLDHFKAMNTRYGHLNVDLLLVEFGKLVRDFLSDGEVALRYGGDEFVLILPNATLEQAAERARLLQDQVRRLVVPLDEQHAIQNLTLSIGIAGWPQHGSTFSELLQSADTALFRAKEKRDEVVIAPPPSAISR